MPGGTRSRKRLGGVSNLTWPRPLLPSQSLCRAVSPSRPLWAGRPEPLSPPYHTQNPYPDLPASFGPRNEDCARGEGHCGPQGAQDGAGIGVGRDPLVAPVDFRVTATSTYILPHLG